MNRFSTSFAVLIALCLLIPSAAHAQKEYNIWYFGTRFGLDFNSGIPVALTDGKLSTPEGCATICDPRTGELLFYTDGMTIWDRSHNVMPQGTGLKGDFSTTQSALIVPLPGSSTIYYVFTAGAARAMAHNPPINTFVTDGIQYSIVDMTLNNGYGDVVTKNVPLLAPAAEKLAAVRHCNGSDVWVAGVNWVTDSFHVYRVTNQGLQPRPVVSSIGFALGGLQMPAGYLEFSPDGRKLAMATAAPGAPHEARIDLYDFDVMTGKISGGRKLDSNMQPYALCFSPDNSKLYAGGSSFLVQHDLLTGVAAGIALGGGTVQSGPDGRLYVTQPSYNPDFPAMLGVIERPNLPGPACSFKPNFMTLGPTPFGSNDANNVGLPTQIRRGYIEPIDRLRDTIICRGGSVRLNVSEGDRYVWSPAYGLSCIDCPDPIASPSEPMTYTVSIIDDLVCGKMEQVHIDIDTLIFTQHDTTICVGEEVMLEAKRKGSTSRYSWTPREGLSCPDCAVTTARPERTTVYTITTVTGDGCVLSDSMVIHVNPLPKIDAGPDVAICPGGSTWLLASGGLRYEWSPVEGLTCNECENPVARPKETTTYTVRTWNDFGCSAVDSVTVFVSRPQVDAGPWLTICPGDSARLRAKGALSYTWSPAEGLSCTDCPDPIATPGRTTKYTVVGADSLGCTAQDTITVVIGSSITATAYGDTTICAGSYTRISAAGGSHFRWTPSDGLSCDNCPEPIATPSVTTRYVVVVRGNGSCPPDSAEVTVAVVPLPVADAGKDVTICGGGSTRLVATGGTEYRWSPADGLSCTDCPDPIASPASSTTYTVVVANGIDCADTASVTVSVAPPIQVEAGTDMTVCPGAEAYLSAKGASRYSWTPVDRLSCTDCPDPIASPLSTTTYIVTGTSSDGCTDSDSVTVSVGLLPVVDLSPDTSICRGETAILRASGGIAYRWSPTVGLSCPDCGTTEARPDSTTDYTVTVSGPDGCTATETVRVVVNDGTMEILARIDRNHRLSPSTGADLPILLDASTAPFTADRIDISIRYDARVLRLTGIDLASTLLDGWTKENEANDMMKGSYSVTLRAPGTETLSGPGTLAGLRFDGFIGPVDSSEIDLLFSIPDIRCRTVRSLPGLARLDSICGLSLRLIRVGLEDFALEPNKPNPFNPATEINFSLGLDGPARLMIFDISGRRVATLIDEPLASGRYAVTWDASDHPSGIYYCRLSSGTWSRTMIMTLVK